MNILLITDSHGKKMAEVLERKKPGWSVLTLRLGGKIGAICRLYQSKMRGIRSFRPDVILMHLGHNDLVMHEVHNRDPRFITTVLDNIFAFAGRIAGDFPQSAVHLSCMLPRVSADRFNDKKVDSYNRMARRFGERLRSRSNQAGSVFGAIINRGMWGRIARWETLSGNHKLDGLHLNSEGREIVASGWIKAILGE